MCETQEINQPVKRGRGRPKKNSPPAEKPPKKANGRPRKYPEGTNSFHHPKLLVDRKRYNELLEIEKKYLEIKNTIVF